MGESADEIIHSEINRSIKRNDAIKKWQAYTDKLDELDIKSTTKGNMSGLPIEVKTELVQR